MLSGKICYEGVLFCIMHAELLIKNEYGIASCKISNRLFDIELISIYWLKVIVAL